MAFDTQTLFCKDDRPLDHVPFILEDDDAQCVGMGKLYNFELNSYDQVLYYYWRMKFFSIDCNITSIRTDQFNNQVTHNLSPTGSDWGRTDVWSTATGWNEDGWRDSLWTSQYNLNEVEDTFVNDKQQPPPTFNPPSYKVYLASKMFAPLIINGSGTNSPRQSGIMPTQGLGYKPIYATVQYESGGETVNGWVWYTFYSNFASLGFSAVGTDAFKRFAKEQRLFATSTINNPSMVGYPFCVKSKDKYYLSMPICLSTFESGGGPYDFGNLYPFDISSQISDPDVEVRNVGGSVEIDGKTVVESFYWAVRSDAGFDLSVAGKLEIFTSDYNPNDL